MEPDAARDPDVMGGQEGVVTKSLKRTPSKCQQARGVINRVSTMRQSKRGNDKMPGNCNPAGTGEGPLGLPFGRLIRSMAGVVPSHDEHLFVGVE